MYVCMGFCLHASFQSFGTTWHSPPNLNLIIHPNVSFICWMHFKRELFQLHVYVVNCTGSMSICLSFQVKGLIFRGSLSYCSFQDGLECDAYPDCYMSICYVFMLCYMYTIVLYCGHLYSCLLCFLLCMIVVPVNFSILIKWMNPFVNSGVSGHFFSSQFHFISRRNIHFYTNSVTLSMGLHCLPSSFMDARH